MTQRSSSWRVRPARWGAVIVALVGLAAPSAAHAQAPPRPAGWQLRTDDPGQPVDSVAFADMAPGWHITTGPAVILYHPDSTASADYRVEVETFLFDPGDRLEGFGIFFGGQNLDGADQRYGYFLVRQDGRYIIKKREGGETPTLRPWTEHPAIAKWADRGDKVTVGNVLAVEVRSDEIALFVNDQQVDSVARSELPTDGVVGLRINHALNLHVSRIDIRPSKR